MTPAIQEAILTLICFGDSTQKSVVLYSLVPANLYDLFYRQVADEAIKYHERYGKPPGDHTLDLFNDLREQRPDDADVYSRLFDSIHENRDSINVDYILDEATKFVRHQRLKGGLLKAVKHLQADKLDEAEEAVTAAMNATTDLFDPGVRLGDERSFEFLHDDTIAFPTGIPELDSKQFGPTRKEVFLLLAPPKRAKTWGLVHLGKHALMNNLRVCHITLEMSEPRMAARYYRSLFAVTKTVRDVKRKEFEKDSLGRLTSINDLVIKQRPSLTDPNIQKVLTGKMDKVSKTKRLLLIKQFPTGALTIRDLEAYLTMLERVEHFMPDLLIVDYADLMRLDTKNYRHEVGETYKQLRGIAVKRNIALATASQTNKASSTAKLITAADVAEDYSKIATVDTAITFNQTATERRLGLARLFVAAGRNEEDQFSILISQNYDMGQFCLDSVRMTSDVARHLDDIDESDDLTD